jgi:hypothetical protein
MSYGEANQRDSVEQLNSLLRGEISAKETYTQAIERIGIEGRDDAEVLREIAREHTGAVERLRDAVRLAGGTPAKSSGMWGAFRASRGGNRQGAGRYSRHQSPQRG